MMKIRLKTVMAAFLVTGIMCGGPVNTLAVDDDFPVKFTLIGIDIRPGSKDEKVLQEMARVAEGRYLSVKAGDSKSLLNAILEGVGVRPPEKEQPSPKQIGGWESVVSPEKQDLEPARTKMPGSVGSKNLGIGLEETGDRKSINSGREGSSSRETKNRDSLGF